MTRAAALALLGVASACASPAPHAAGAGCADAPPDPSQRCVVAGAQYAAGPVHGWLLGSGYRALWTAPITVPVLDLDRTAGGLVPLEHLGHGQSATLALRGGDGRAYSFRTTDKDMRQAAGAAGSVPGVAAAYRDQTASGHPGAPLVASALARAAGVLEPEPRLVVLAASPRLGAFAETFAERLGTFEEYPTPADKGRPGTFGAIEIVKTEELLGRLQADPAERVDARAYLRARLVDLVLGDVDRHPGQWRFARLAPRGAWEPLPEDRDLAFARFDGALLRVARPWFPLLGRFDERIHVGALAPQAVVTDTWLLAPLSRAAWREEAASVQRALSPAAIERAVDVLPAEWRELDGARLAERLRRRVAALPAAADALYERLAAAVDVHGTAAAERVRAIPRGEATEIRVTAAGRREPTFERVLDPGETHRLRLCGFDPTDSVSLDAVRGFEVRVEPRCEVARPIVIESVKTSDSQTD